MDELKHAEYTLTSDESNLLGITLDRINIDQNPISEDEVLSASYHLLDMMPPRLIEAFGDMARKGSDLASLYVRNLPIKRPKGFSKSEKNSELLLAALTYIVGSKYVAQDHRDGKAILNLIPKKEHMSKQLATGVELEWHTEDAHISNSARFICLIGLRGDPQAKTHVSTTDIGSISESLRSLLTLKEYTTSSDESYHSIHEEKTALLNMNSIDLYQLRFDPLFTKATSKDFSSAIAKLKLLLETNNKKFQLDTGDLLIFNNRIAAHKRSNFNPTYSKTDRWVQRIMLT